MEGGAAGWEAGAGLTREGLSAGAHLRSHTRAHSHSHAPPLCGVSPHPPRLYSPGMSALATTGRLSCSLLSRPDASTSAQQTFAE